MVFSSIPAYIDPSNWQQQQNHHHQIIGSTTTNPLLAQQPQHPGPPPPPSQPQPPNGGLMPSSIRPGSMSERARIANIPMPETALKCPRCESTNTKFCYFNNYSLSQPRHFCKTCRRYWTRGGALRNVPVGGGCRRNKRSKSSSSKSPGSNDRQNTPNTPTSTSTNNMSNNLLGLTPPQFPPLRFMSPLSQLTENFTSDHIGLNYSGMTGQVVGTTSEQMNFHGSTSLFSGGGVIEPWRMQQFPFFGGSGLDVSTQTGGYQFQGGELGFVGAGESSTSHNNNNDQVIMMRPKFSSSMMMSTTTQTATPVKTEEIINPHHELNLSRQIMLGGMQGNNDQEQWNTNTNTNTNVINANANGGANWTDLSSFSSCSTSNAL